ncbi:WecB/TagA/CpsF family glycosyltransferase [Sphingomicrobium astaxanthinifaciens]|uniref:WecB/TagA/CpsF family glycosyltransferase n=1 Tax=Sphingomicrobium astaxanthinifaciens TaxID=1227949 RepID=UPI001FCB88F1|nr:WecB/TagA/CpsF family glycosyltransferase [Sphingomicrobium astaxanthinifaciens]MCJ7420514.1 WecB/TagA/CpsF family glycosyltransferase [Sphingomicrobium astaxanthinifaciens]
MHALPSPAATPAPVLAQRTSIFGIELVHAGRGTAAAALVQRAAERRDTVVSFVNAHCINTAVDDAAYRDCLRRSDLLLPDGVGMAIAARLAGKSLGENLNGTDLYPDLCRHAAREGVGLFLLGGEHGIASEAGAAMQERFASLKIAGTMHGYFRACDDAVVIERINRSGAGILLVGMGVPHQERWIARNRHRISVPVILGVGGLFDYYSGRIARAPRWVRAARCEWMWRLAQEPRRLARRYLVGNVRFLAHTLRHALVTHRQHRLFGRLFKRLTDGVGALVALVLLAPLLLLVALAIRCEDGGPILFGQVRVGRNGKNFRMWKFRSMVTDAEARRAALLARSERDDVCFKMKRDPRITRVGALIRRFSIDELPQLFNVLGGTMSLVGPRPALPAEVQTYRERSWGRLGGKPGITCIWQVSGRAEIPFDQQVLMDIDYLTRRSWWLDFQLMLRTIPAIVSGRGAY